MIFRVLKSLTAIAFLIAGAGAAWAQETVRGTVTDPLGAAVKDATVTLTQGSAAAGKTTTNAEGAFTFSAVTAGRYHVQVDAVGFAADKGQDVFADGSGVTTVDVLLQLAGLAQAVVVSATGSAMPISQVGASVSLIDNDEIQAENKLDVLENLRQVSGAQIVQTGQRGGTTSLFIRGGESSYNKVMIDGAPSNGIGGAFEYAQLSNSGVESIEVLKGANSVLYGADALAGVVNVTTQHGTTAIPELKVSSDGGNFGTMDNAASFAGAFRQFDYFSEFSRSDTHGTYQNEFFHNATYAGNFGWRLNSKTTLRATYRRNWTGAGVPNALSLYGISDDSSQKNQNTYFTGTLQNQTTSRWHNLVRFAFGQFNSTYTNPTPSGTPDAFGNYLGNPVKITGGNGYTVTGQAILDYAGAYPQAFPSYEARRSVSTQSDYRFFKDWTGVFGFRYEHEDGSGYIRDNYSYFSEVHGNIAHRLYVTAGVGFEKNTVFGFAATPRVSAAYYLRPFTSHAFFTETKLRFNFGKGIKEPSTYQQGNQLYAILTPAQRAQFNVSPVGPERSRDFDYGIEQGLFRGRARLEVTYFQNRFYDLITFLGTGDLVSIGVNASAAAASGFGAYVNASSTSSKGAETQFTSDLGHGLRFQANYTYLDAVVTKAFGTPSFNPAFPTIPIGAFSALQGQEPFRRAPHSGSVGLTYAHAKFTGSFTGYMVGRSDDSTFLTDGQFGNSLLLPNHNLLQAYQKFDLSGRYQLKPFVSLFVSAQNVFSEHYQAAFGYPAAPMTFRAGLTFTIGGDSWRR